MPIVPPLKRGTEAIAAGGGSRPSVAVEGAADAAGLLVIEALAWKVAGLVAAGEVVVGAGSWVRGAAWARSNSSTWLNHRVAPRLGETGRLWCRRSGGRRRPSNASR